MGGKVNVSAVLDALKRETNGLSIANDVKEKIIDHFENKLSEEITVISTWATELMELQNKRTIQMKEWEFIINKLLK
jgi:siroheme synthase (precorrin-2 oxidase/ferrochelatase)